MVGWLPGRSVRRVHRLAGWTSWPDERGRTKLIGWSTDSLAGWMGGRLAGWKEGRPGSPAGRVRWIDRSVRRVPGRLTLQARQILQGWSGQPARSDQPDWSDRADRRAGRMGRVGRVNRIERLGGLGGWVGSDWSAGHRLVGSPGRPGSPELAGQSGWPGWLARSSWSDQPGWSGRSGWSGPPRSRCTTWSTPTPT